MAGLLLVIARRWRDPWWRFVLYGLAASIVPGAITDWPFHELRLMGYAVFLLVLTVPALEWLLAADEPKQTRMRQQREESHRGADRARSSQPRPRRAQSGSAFLESCWQRPLHKPSISNSLSGVKDQARVCI